MEDEDYEFEGLEPIVGQLTRRTDDIAYVVMQDRTVAGQDEKVGRFDFTPEQFEALGLDWSDDSQEVAQQAVAWIREAAIEGTRGHGFRRFRVKSMGPKGLSMVHSGQFICRERDDDRPSPKQAEADGVAHGMAALGRYYADWGRMVLGSITHLQGIHEDLTGRLHEQLTESRGQVDTLVGSILEARVQDATAREERALRSDQHDVKASLARDALQQIGEAAKAFWMSQGLPPDTAELLQLLGRSPRLTEALNRPEVRHLMKDPKHLEDLAAMLEQVAKQVAEPTP
ncbi:MAG: hypothetical protein R3F61_35670 [Myxococcota bacterium]